jgi:hypothetical protein
MQDAIERGKAEIQETDPVGWGVGDMSTPAGVNY